MTRLPFFVLLATGCKVVDAPESVEELVVFGFVNFDEGPEFLEAFAAGAVDARANTPDLVDGVRTDSLTPDILFDNDFSNNPDANEVFGVAATIDFESDFDSVVDAVTGDMSTVIPSTEIYERTVVQGDRDCFLTHACDAFDMDVRRVVGGFWGTGEQQVLAQFRWTTLEDGTDVMVYRSLAPDPMETDSVLFKAHQHFTLYTLVDASVPEKFETHWVEAELIGIDLPDTFAIDSAVSSMQSQVEDIDAFIQGDD